MVSTLPTELAISGVAASDWARPSGM
jgi:hypothetical protein